MIRLLRTRYRTLMLIALCLLMITSVLSLNGQEINIPTVTQNVCPDLQFLMERTISPYDLGVGGGTLNIGGTTSGSIANTWYADLWSFNFASEGTQEDLLTLRFSSSNDDLQLEFALFLGMDKVSSNNRQSDYQPVDNNAVSYPLQRDGIYTLVIRQTALSASTNDNLNGTYTIDASLSSGRQYNTQPEPRTDVRDETNNRSVSPAPIIPAGTGYQFIDLQTDLYTHPNAVNNVSSLNFASTRAEYGIVGSGFLLNNIYDEVQLFGGDLVIKGTTPETSQNRILYVQDYDYRTFFGDSAGNLTAIQSEDGTNIQLNWDIMQGVWITENCAGFMLTDGTRFISPIIPQQRTVTFRTDRTQPDEFDIRLVAPNPDAIATRYEIDLNWRGVQPASQLSLIEGMFNLELIGGRSLHLEATRMDIRRVEENTLVVPTTPLSVSLLGRGSTLRIDWVDLNSFTLTNTLGMFNFDDTRGTVSRELTDLDRLEIIGGNVYTIFDDSAQSLWLGQENGFVELITPATAFPYNSLAVAGETGYIPHALNNTGGECYPVNTMLPEANCPSNGYPNPANGNLWLSISDLQAFGGLIDLTLTRNYNSLFSTVDGPFGAGWTGLFLLDYNVAFDPSLGSRRIDQSAVANYPVSLNLIWSPQGIVTFTTPSGSQHTFLGTNRNYSGGEQSLTALTMPGWRLTRETVYGDWTLTQPDGLTYVFDPAGRLRTYGYPEQGRVIAVDYPRNTLNGPGSIGERPVIISDAPETRQLELYYNEAHHIERAVLRDLNESVTTCREDEDAFITIYNYDDALLKTVDYADCQQATYDYDENAVLNQHDDPRAPIAQQMTYRHDDKGFLNAIIEQPDASPIIWRARTGFTIINNAINLPERRQVSIAGDEFAERTYTYQLVRGDNLQLIDNSYILVSQTSPLASTAPPSENLESRPISYEWVNGLLSGELLRTMTDDRGRNSIRYTYTPDGTISGVSGGYPAFSAAFSNNGNQQNLTFADGSTIAITHNANGFTYMDRQGGAYTTLLNAENRVESVISEDDDSVVTYGYDGTLGLVNAVSHHLVDAPETSYYTVRYLYDAFGRLIMIDDPDEEGAYTISYPAPQSDEGETVTDIVMTDPTGAITRLRFNQRGELVENKLISGGNVRVEGEYLRRTTYTYDVLGRLHTETRWLGDIVETDGTLTLNETPLTTSYDYVYRLFDFAEDGILQTERVVPSQENTNIDRAPNTINGYQIIVTEPGDTQQQVYVYDALERIQQVEDEFRNISRYSYMTDNFQAYSRALPNGLRIDQQDYSNNEPTTSSQYLFDLSWRLRFASRTIPAINDDATPIVQTWEFLDLTDANNAPTEVLRAPSAGVSELTWSQFDEGLPTSMEVTQSDIRLTSGATVSYPRINATYDFQGRPVTIQDGVGNTYYVCYTPLDGGHRQTHVTLTFADGCQLNADSRITEYDARDRIVFTQDASGTRDYIYETAENGWQVTITTREALSGQEFTWELGYNSAGDLRTWLDEAGIRRVYDYDTLGHLLHVETTGNDNGIFTDYPEASTTYTYNVNNLVTSTVDNLQRGTRHAYNNFGQLTVAQDVNTGNAVIYGYSSTGQLTTVISPLGSTTTYLYEDPADPSRITGIIDPTGNTLRFNWNDPNRQLTYTDARGNRIIYTFDSFDALWRIDDSFGTEGNITRSHEIHYDNAGNLTAWLQSLVRQTPNRTLNLDYSDPYTVTFSLPALDDWQRTLERTAYDQLVGISTTPESQDILSFYYDPFGRLNQVISGELSSEEHRLWTLAYQSGEQTVTVNDGFDNVYTLGFDALNQLVSQEDPENDLTTTYDYEENNGAFTLSARTDGTDTERSITYSPGVEGVRPPTITLDAPGQRTTYFYNANGLLDEIRTETCLVTAENTADLAEDEVCVTGGDEIVWRTTEQFVYDAENRPIRYIDAEDNIAFFAYDDVGNLSNYQNLRGQTFNYNYDSLNRLAHITGPTGIRLLLDYNGTDNVVGICQTRAERELTYSQCETSNNPNDFVIETYDYDALGRITAQNFQTAIDDAIEDTTVAYHYEENNNHVTDWGISGEGSVSIGRSDDGLSLVDNLTIAPSIRGDTIQYEALDQVDSIGAGTDEALDYVYDSYGRIDRIIARDHALDYRYDADGGYTVRDETSGAEIHFGLNENGLLNLIDYTPSSGASSDENTDVNSDEPLVKVDIDYRYNATRRLLTVSITWSNGEIIELLLDHNGTTRNTIYNVQTNLLIDYVGDAEGGVQRRGLTGSSILFEGDNTGYITQIGYDNDGRPFNMRITGRTSGALLYLLTFTYNQQGQRETETRQYRSGEQISITYNYNTANQLRARIFSIRRTRPFSASGAPLLLLLPLLGGFFKPVRRRTVVLFGLVVFSTGLMLTFGGIFTTAQQSETFTQIFTYNIAGNLKTVRIEGTFNQSTLDEVCATYTYDAANRLIEVTRGEGANEVVLQNYDYDVYNRLVQVGDEYLAYLGDSNTLIARYDGDSTTPIVYGQTLRRSGFFRAEGENVDWFITDGRQSVLATVPNDPDDTSGLQEPVQNLDPLGRFILLDPLAQSTMIDWCSEIETLTNLSYTQIVEPDMVWDAVTNLYLKQGRAYSPQIGRYLQRDSRGPDVFGNVYNYPSRQSQPPVRVRPPAYADGLYVLADAYDTITNTTQFTAQDILAENLPALERLTITPLVDELSATTRITQQALLHELQLPTWLRRQYNLPGAFIDNTGALRLLPDTAPGQGGNPQSDPLPELLSIIYPDSLPLPTIGTPLNHLQGYVATLNPIADPYTTYQPFAWLPEMPALEDAWSIPVPNVGTAYSAQAVFDWLPQALDAPENATSALHAIESILSIPDETGASWLATALDASLPQLPELPPETSTEWLNNWFTRDTLGIADALAQRLPTIPTTGLPVYELARNRHWFDLDRLEDRSTD